MVRELLVLRHGKAKELAEGRGETDACRPLKDRGKRQAQKIGAWMQQQAVLPTLVLSSPAERALVSTQKALKAAGLNAHSIHIDDRLYMASQRSLLRILAEYKRHSGTIMIVGHNPGLEGLVHHLVGPSLRDIEGHGVLKTGTLVRLSMPISWTELPYGCARLLNYVFPDTLAMRFPFPDTTGTEYRDRPAYYYTQSAAIPFRESVNGLEILVITSSKKKHWVVPKGIHEPGLTAQASAAKEAKEEAGVWGNVDDVPAGEYVYEKWGAPCHVVVYPMEVTEITDEKDWDANYRVRRWVSPAQAVARLKEEALKVIVADFAARHGTA